MKYKIKQYQILIFIIFFYSFIRHFVLYFFTKEFFISSYISGVLSDIVIILFPLLLFKVKTRLYISIVSLFLSLSNFIAIVHLFQYKTKVSMGAFAAIAETSSQEFLEFFKIITTWEWIFAFFLSFILVFLSLVFIQKENFIKRKEILKILLTSVVIFFFINVVFASFQQDKTIFRGLTLNNSSIYQDIKRIAYYYREKEKLDNLVKERKKQKFFVRKKNNSDKQIFVLIIGESMSRKHLSIYGYKRETTPLLAKTDSLLIYKDVISSATRTTPSITRMLSLASVKNKSFFYTKGSIITLAKNAGFKTVWISNQQLLGISDTEVSVLANDADKHIFLNTDWHTNSLDEKIFPYLDKALLEKANKVFIVIHLLGSHFDYYKRYPNIDKFLIKDKYNFPNYLNDNQKNIWKQYDNSISYTDYIITTIIDKVKNKNTISSVLFLSDHGEEVFDDNKKITGHGRSYVKKEVVEVPFILWNSYEYYKIKNKSYEYLKNTTIRPYSSQDLFFAIADLLELDFPEKDLTKSLFSHEFIHKKRFIINSEKKIISYEDVKKN